MASCKVETTGPHHARKSHHRVTINTTGKARTVWRGASHVGNGLRLGEMLSALMHYPGGRSAIAQVPVRAFTAPVPHLKGEALENRA